MAVLGLVSGRIRAAVPALVLLVGLVYWVADLSRDPPMYFDGLTQSMSTDPAINSLAARNGMLFSGREDLDNPRYRLFGNSLLSAVAFGVFSIRGVSQASSGLAGVLLSFASFSLLLVGLRRHMSAAMAAAITFCLISNVSLLTYGRLAYLEHGMVFCAAAVFAAFSLWGRSLWAVVVCGVLVAATAVTGKLLGALLLPALIAAILCSDLDRKALRAVVTTAGFLVSSVLLILVLYGSTAKASYAFVGEKTADIGVFAAGLSSPWGFLEYVAGFGFKYRLFWLSPEVFLCLAGLATALVLFIRSRADLHRLSPSTIMASCWLLAAWLGLMPLGYAPLRYFLLLIPVAIVAFFSLAHDLRSRGPVRIEPLGIVRTALLGVVFWMILYQLVGNIFFHTDSPYQLVTWVTLPGAAVLTGVARMLISRFRPVVSGRMISVTIASVLIVTAVNNGYRVYRYHHWERNFNLLEANEDMREILGRGAVVSGPYGPALTVNTETQAYIHLFDNPRLDSALLRDYPVTHIAVDVSNLQAASQTYPELDTMAHVAAYWIRDFKVKVYNVSGLSRNPEARRYRPTHYERATEFFFGGMPDSALAEVQLHLRDHSMTKSPGTFLANLYFEVGRFGEAKRLMIDLADRYPTDFEIQRNTGELLRIEQRATGNASLTAKASEYFERARRANPYGTASDGAR